MDMQVRDLINELLKYELTDKVFIEDPAAKDKKASVIRTVAYDDDGDVRVIGFKR